jgi:hypothetical protein
MSENILAKSTIGTMLLCAVTAASAIGCASDTESSMEGDAPQALQAPGSETILPNPDGVYFASVNANGTGCPAGTWETSLSPDGETFTTTFSAYEAAVDETKTISVKDCLLAIKLHSPQGMSYSVSQFHYSGYAFLDQGVSGRQIAKYYFQGNPVDSDEKRTEMKGEFDDTYLFSDSIELTDAVWSPCGTTRDLNIVTRLRLQNSSPRRTGYMNLNAVDGSTKLEFKLSWRKCDAPGTSNGGRDAGSTGGGIRTRT